MHIYSCFKLKLKEEIYQNKYSSVIKCLVAICLKQKLLMNKVKRLCLFTILFSQIYFRLFTNFYVWLVIPKKKYFSTFFRPHFYFIFEPATIFYFVFKFKHFNEMVAKWENFNFF